MKKQVDDEMAAQLLANGEVKVDNLYSAKKDKYFSAKFAMEIIDDIPEYSLEFPKITVLFGQKNLRKSSGPVQITMF